MADEKLPGALLPLVERLEDILSGLLPEPRQRGDRPILARSFKLRQRVNAKLVVEHFDLLRPKPLEFKQRENIRRELLAKLLVEGQ